MEYANKNKKYLAGISQENDKFIYKSYSHEVVDAFEKGNGKPSPDLPKPPLRKALLGAGHHLFHF